jgi:hypothetical protein
VINATGGNHSASGHLSFNQNVINQHLEQASSGRGLVGSEKMMGTIQTNTNHNTISHRDKVPNTQSPYRRDMEEEDEEDMHQEDLNQRE